MKILAHRGCWNTPKEKNTLAALHRALDNGFGIESDLRDYMGKLVISHNMANADCPQADEIFQRLAKYQDRFCFAINIKADGLKDELARQLSAYKITNYFTFDMSIPQLVEYSKMGLVYFTRQSEVEPEPVMYEDAAGVWIDGFEGTDWITEALLQTHISQGKQVCLVSPELHQRKYIPFWQKLSLFHLNWDNVILCTDKPVEAAKYFKVGVEIQ